VAASEDKYNIKVGVSLSQLNNKLYDHDDDDNFDNDDFFIFDLDNLEQGRFKTIHKEQLNNVTVKGIISGKTTEEEADELAISITSDSSTTNYTVGETSLFYHTMYRTTVIMSSVGLANYDTTKSAKDQIYSTDETTGAVTTYHDYFMETAIDDMVRITALYDVAVKNGLTATDVKDEVNQQIAAIKQEAADYGYGSSYERYLAAMYGSYLIPGGYVTPAVYEDYITRHYIASKYFSNYQDSIPDENAETWVDELKKGYLVVKGDGIKYLG